MRFWYTPRASDGPVRDKAMSEVLPAPFQTLAEEATVEAETDAEISDVPGSALEIRESLKMGKQMRWLVCRIDTKESTKEVFELLRQPLLGRGHRRLSVRQGIDEKICYALLFKDDQAVLDLAALDRKVQPSAVFEILKPGKGQAGARAIAKFAEAWFTGARRVTSNFAITDEAPEEEQGAPVQEVYGQLPKERTELHMEHWEAKRVPKKRRSAWQDSVVEGWSDIQALKRDEEHRAAKRKRTEGVVFREGIDATRLAYPRDFPRLGDKVGTTYDPRTEKDVLLPLSDYVNTRLHFEKVLVLWGKGGRGKTPAAEAIARRLAISYGSMKYVKISAPDAMRTARDEMERYVPVVFEDMRADDESQHGKKLTANYLKHLLNVPDGGQCRVRYAMIKFLPLQPRILCINDPPQEWLKAVGDLTDNDGVPLRKRLLFVEVDEKTVAEKAVEKHEEDLDALVCEGRRRCQQYFEEQDVSTTASCDGESDGSSAPLSDGANSPVAAPVEPQPTDVPDTLSRPTAREDAGEF